MDAARLPDWAIKECRRLGDPKRGIEYLKEALEIFREIGDKRGEENVLHDLEEAQKQKGD